jgi:hypothetical protein
LKGGFWFDFVCSKTIGGVGENKRVVSAEHPHENFTRCLFFEL